MGDGAVPSKAERAVFQAGGTARVPFSSFACLLALLSSFIGFVFSFRCTPGAVGGKGASLFSSSPFLSVVGSIGGHHGDMQEPYGIYHGIDSGKGGGKGSKEGGTDEEGNSGTRGAGGGENVGTGFIPDVRLAVSTLHVPSSTPCSAPPANVECVANDGAPTRG